MSEASSGQAAGGEPGGHETPTTGAVQLTWQCTNSVCRKELDGIPPNALPLCPFCGKPQEGFSHRAPSNVSGPPQSTATQEEPSQHPEEPKSSDVNISMDASSSTKANSGVEVTPPPADDEASKRSGEDLPETPPNMCPKMDRAQDHSDSPEPGIEAVSSPQLPLAASAAAPSSPSTELHPPSVPLPLPTGPSPLPPDGPPPSQTGPSLPMGGFPTSHPPVGPPLPPGDPPSPQTGPSPPPGGPPPPQTGPSPPQTGPPSPQMGPSPPQTGPSPPQTGPPSPRTGPSPPQTGPSPPQTGPPSPQTGPSPPQMGPSPPQTGPPSPQTGPSPPQMGPPSPRTGPSPPQTGPSPPQTGPPSPQTGPSPPQMGSSPPQTGPSPPQTGPPSPRTGPSPPQTGPSPPQTGPTSPQTGPSPPQMGPSPPQTGPPSPQTGPSPPQTGPPSPRTGPSPPQTGPSPPQTGPPSPQTGPSPPQTGPSPPQTGPPSPRMGPSPPQTGPPSPQTGPSPPQMGPSPPQTGSPSPRMGPSPPQTGPSPPQTGPSPSSSKDQPPPKPTSTDDAGRVETEAGQQRPGAGEETPAANTRSKSDSDGKFHRKADDPPKLFEGTSKKGKGAGKMKSDVDVTTLGIPAFDPPPNRSLAVTFHVLLPIKVWNWSDDSHIQLVFGHSKMGKWDQSVGTFGAPVRMVDEVLCEMQCTLHIDIEVLRSSSTIPYKYIVYSPKRKGKDSFEFIHHAPIYGITNRCLSIPSNVLHAPGTFDVFDSMVYPREESIVTKLWDRAKSFITGSGTERHLVVPDHNTMQIVCLHAYLANLKKVLIDLALCSKTSVGIAVSHVMLVFKQLYTPLIMREHGNSWDIWTASEVLQEIMKWLRSIIEEVQKFSISSESNGRRIATILVIIICYYKLDSMDNVQVKLQSDDVAKMLAMLELKPDKERNSCCDFDYVKSLLDQSTSKDTILAFHFLCNFYTPIEYVEKAQWLYALPLIHFLKEMCKPFAKPQLNPEKIVWYDISLPLLGIERSVRQGYFKFVETHFEAMGELFAVDPCLLPIFVRICPKMELRVLLRKLPPHVSLSWLSKLTLDLKDWRDKVEQLRLYAEDVTTVVKALQVAKHDRPNYIEATLLGSLMYLSSLRGKVLNVSGDNTGKENICLLKRIIELISNAAMQLDIWYKSHSEEDTSDVSKCVDMLTSFLKELVADRRVIGGSMFGYTELKKADMEFHLWESLLSVDLHEGFLDKWHTVIYKIVKSRVNELAFKLKIELLKKLKAETHSVLADVFVETAMHSLERMKSKRDAAVAVNEMILRVDKKRVGELMGTLIRKQYPDGANSVTFDELLQWDLWPSIIKVHTNEALMMKDSHHGQVSCLPENCISTCVVAYSIFTDLCDRLVKGMVTVTELEKMCKRQEHIKSLCAAVCADTKESNTKSKFTALKTSLGQRMAELEALRSHKEQLDVLCRYINITITGLEELQVTLKMDIASKNICQLCTSDGDQHFSFPYLPAAVTLAPMLRQFFLLKQKHPNTVFEQMWSRSLKTASSSGSVLYLTDIVSQVWDPTFKSCQVLLESLMNQSVQLIVVDEYFHRYSHDCKVLSETVTVFYCGMLACTEGKEPTNLKWIESVVYSMQQYWSLSRYSDAAATLLQLKDELQLTGDFTVVKQLAAKVSKSMQDQPLKAIDRSLVDTGRFLDEFVTSRRKLRCLEIFCECRDIVEWLKKETKDVSDLQNFVSVALSTAAGGEGDLANDQLSNLRTVASGFGNLIYDLESDAGFLVFKDCCKSLWESLEQSPNLPILLGECNKELGWYKAVKDTQGSVERSTFGQMNAIIQYGRYRVDSSTLKVVKSIHKVISVVLEERDKRLHKRFYTLDELRDLESKLVLITGSRAENRETVDLFLDTLHCVCRIAEALIALQQAGEVEYIGWSIVIPCTENMLAVLREVAEDMEQRLNVWNEEVALARERFYELNYFTTVQLLMLRKDMAQVKNPDVSCAIGRGALTLLQSVSAVVDIDTVQNVVRRDCGQHSDVEHFFSDGPIEQHVELTTYPPEQSILSTIFSTADEHASSNSITKPNVSTCEESKLSEKQLEIIAHLTERYDFSEKFVRKALQECGEDDYDCMNWCRENDGKYTFSDDESDTESEDEMTSDAESEEAIDILSTEPSEKAVTDSVSLKIKVTAKLLIDASHPEVLRLQDAGYILEDSITAIQRCGSASAAVEYLMSTEADESEELFQPSRVFNRTSSGDHTGAVFSQREITIQKDMDATSKYLSLQELGLKLRVISEQLPPTGLQSPRLFSSYLKSGEPNLIVRPPENVLKMVLALYMEEESSPLPTCDEVLICNQLTTEEEVTLLWRRAIGDPGFKRIFCLVHAENLSYQVCDRALHSLQDISQGRVEYRVVIVCSNQDEDKSHIISKLEMYRKQFVMPKDENFKHFLRQHFTISEDSVEYPIHQHGVLINASAVDPDNSCVRVVSSLRSGMGKSLYIRRKTELLSSLNPHSKGCVTIPVHGPVVNSESILAFLKDHMENSNGTIFHIDVSPSVLHLMDTILFSLLVLRGLRDSLGNVWRCHTNQLYAVEVTKSGTKQEQQRCCLALLDLLPTVECITPAETLEAMTGGSGDITRLMMDDGEYKSERYQRVYQYLRRHIANLNLDTFSYLGTVEQSPTECLNVLRRHCGVTDPSWSEICHFVTFLDIQLQTCEQSVFCNEAFVGDVMSGLKSFVVNFMMAMSKDFATSSLHGEVARENREEAGKLDDQTVQYAIDHRKQWEQNAHPYIFFNRDGASITFVGFKVSPDGRILDPNGGIIKVAKMSPQLLAGLKHNKVNFAEDYRQWGKPKMIEKVGTVLGLDFVYDPDPTYVLTADNLVKILAIHMRFRCNIPVVIMGETGCGKTRLIRFMCDLMAQGSGQQNMLILKVHGGITEQDIIKFVKGGIKVAEENREHNLDTVLFFDEANTTDAIGLIKEIMCDRRLQGRPLSTDVKFIAACNPYRKHSEEMISKLESAGLGFYVRMNETLDKLGSIPLRQLVYRVLDLPPSMRPLVYDFGQLNPKTEQDYSYQIVLDYVSKANTRLLDPNKARSIARVLAFSQQYMRETKDECSFVSLRDVKRAMIVFDYFLGKMNVFGDLINAKAEIEEDEDLEPPDPVTRSLVLALGVCYHARLQVRENYENWVAAQFSPPLNLPGGGDQFKNEIRYCQEVLLDNMKIGKNIAKNAALRENIFMMAVCIELRIPLFLVGKPGSSKSLAKSIIADSMRGKVSQSLLLRDFKEVHMLSFQCSQLSTPEGVIEVFATAKRFQKDQDTSKYVSVVVLDEVGLAEDSPNLPLKALHPLLEDGTEQSDVDEIVDPEKRVAFIGISNWALDPAKMNRGVMVTRSDPDEEELEFSARGICSFQEGNDPVKKRLEPYFKELASAYKEVYQTQHRDFFGLRDFYSLIKMLYWMCEQSGIDPTAPQLEHAIRRNFGGWEDEDLNPLKVFRARVHATEPPDLSAFAPERQQIICPDCTKLGLIKTSLKTKETTWHGENRYLLFLTENYAALDILRHYLQDALSSTLSDSSIDENTEPFILFGSSFPRDKEYTQVCRNINRIKICMETGRTVILLNLENLYESLYDLLNQYYLHQGGQRYVDLGLQTLRVKCRVHDNFKLILIAEKTTVYERFPTPLINRLEKHFVLTSSVLQDWQQHVLKNLNEWISNFSEVIHFRDKKFKEEDAFIGYQKDTPAAAVFQATNQLEKLCKRHPSTVQKWIKVLKSGFLKYTLDDITEEMALDQYQEMVLALSKYLMLQTAPEDALIRLKETRLANSFDQQIQLYLKFHFSTVSEFLKYHINSSYQGSGQMFQVTTHSHLIPENKVFELEHNLNIKVSSCVLQQFDTELDFTNSISPSFKERGFMDRLLIIQCDSGHMSGDLIACARYRVLEERRESIQRGQLYSDATGPDSVSAHPKTHVLFIIHLPKREFGSSFVGFQGDPWVCTHIDNLLPSDDSIGTPQLQDVMGRSISELFYQSEDVTEQDSFEVIEFDTQYMNHDDMEHSAAVVPVPDRDTVPKAQVQNFCIRLHGCIHAAVARVEDVESHPLSKNRAKIRVDILLRLIPKEPSGVIDQTTFFGIIVTHIHHLLNEREHIYEQGADWVLVEALDTKKLQSNGTLRNVIARKLDDEMSRPFTEIIAFIDRHYNLDLLDEAFNDRSKAHFARLWLAIFGLETILPFKFSDLIIGQKVPGIGGRMFFSDFKCQFPFSWVVKQTFDDVWINAKTVAGPSKLNRRNQLCEEVQKTYIGQVLMEVDDSDSHCLYECYLHDFVRMVHDCRHKNPTFTKLEYKLLCKSLDNLVLCEEFSAIDRGQNLLQLIASLHVIYHLFESDIMWFGQLVSGMPQILQKLESVQYTDSEEMILHLCAVECALASGTLGPPMEKKEEVWNNWLTLLRQSRIAMDSILNISAQHPRAIEARKKWQLTRVLQLFVEHVLLKHEQIIVAQVRRLNLFLENDSDFLKASAIEKVKRHLNGMITHSRKKQKSNIEIKNSCRAFFMEVISSLCFGGVGVPEPHLVKLLLDTVFINSDDEEQISTRNLTPYEEEHDSVPVIRSFILQLLLEHSSTQVKEHLNEYFVRSNRALSRKHIDNSVCLLIVKCFEDNLYREHDAKPLTERMKVACSFLKSGGDALVGHVVVSDDVTVEYLEGVAGVRFALVLVADLLNSRIDGTREHYFTAQANELLTLAKTVCTDTRINHIDMTGTTDTIGPNVYLLKLLVRLFGSARMMEVSKTCDWVLPPQLKTENNEVKTHDPFVIYERVYSDLRLVLNDAAYGKQFQKLKEAAEALTPQDAPLLLLALYEKATLSRASVLPSKQLLPEVFEVLEDVIQESKFLSNEMKLTARRLIANDLGQMQVTSGQSAHYRVIEGVVIHAATVLLHRKRMRILLPFINMLTSPKMIANVFLPTMPQDHLAEVRKAGGGGTFYECPRGHVYYIGDCGRPVVERDCPVCGSRIGGTGYRLQTGNKGARTHDTTRTGYALGNPEDRSEVPTPERTLSSASCSILRALMHCALVWASCNNEPTLGGELCQLVQKQPHELAEFFWRHLERDLELLGKAINKNAEECALALHLVLKNIVICDKVPPGDVVENVIGLGSQDAREIWEDLFNKTYIQPVLERVDKSIGDAMGVILNDDHQEHDNLFYLVYERVTVSKDTLAPHLWTYRARITLEHLSQTLQQQSSTAKYPILLEFLKEESSLRATQYLPDIIKLQQKLYDRFHRRYDRRDIAHLTIGELFRQQTNELARNEYRVLIDSFKCAWQLIRDKLHDHGRLRVDEEYISQDINDTTPLEYLIPTTTGAGACSMALADFLTLTHNSFILKSRTITNKGTARNYMWDKCEVPITHLHRCHLLDYEHQLLSIILSHCHYSLTLGKGEDVSYDLPALEKHILDRFIHGKPTILADIPQVVYRRDVYNAATFAAIRVKVKPQVRLSTQAQHEIVAELRSMEKLRSNLDVVEIVIGFLSSGGGRTDKPLVDYIRTLKMSRKSFSKKAKEHCTLGHVLSLWELLSVHLAKRLALKDQDPFDTLPAEFHDDITSGQEKSLDHCLGSFEISQLLGVLYEFLEVYIRHSPPTDKEWPVVETLVSFQDRYEIPPIAHFEDKFPPDISLAQAAAAWKYIVVYQASAQAQDRRVKSM